MKKSLDKVDTLNELSYHDNMPHIIEFVKKFWNINVQPKGYAKLRKGYQDFDGMENYNYERLTKAFKGFDSTGAGSYGLPEQLSTPHVVYNECCQGRDCIETLLGAVFSYAWQCGAKYQELKTKKDFESKIKLAEVLHGISQRTGEKPNDVPNISVEDVQFVLEFSGVV